VANIELAAFYRAQAVRMIGLAATASNQASRLELMEMATTFQRLAAREEEIDNPDSDNAQSA
jgi:hypothetical protein